jgi:hypothetical protein
MMVLELRLSFTVVMPHPSPHWSQQEMLDASCGLDTFCFRRPNDSKTDTKRSLPAVDQEMSKKQFDICDAPRITRSHHN